MSNFVTVDGLTKRYGDFTAVDDLSFSVEVGEIFGFLGPNGAGKSTTLNVLCNLIDYDRGQIAVGGYDIKRDARKAKSLIGLVPQEIALYPTLTASENVGFFASLYGLKGAGLKTAVETALEFVGLSEHMRQRAGKMSGGMQRRLNIACGIAHKPKLIVMDEPTVGVDAQSRDHIMNAIRTLRKDGATVIYTSHYMPEVQDICDRIAIIDGGKLVGLGTENELLKVVTDVKTIAIAARAIDAKTSGLLSSVPDVKRVVYDKEKHELRIDVPLNFDKISLVLQTLLDNGTAIDNMRTEAASLETTFLALTGKELH